MCQIFAAMMPSNDGRRRASLYVCQKRVSLDDGCFFQFELQYLIIVAYFLPAGYLAWLGISIQ